MSKDRRRNRYFDQENLMAGIPTVSKRHGTDVHADFSVLSESVAQADQLRTIDLYKSYRKGQNAVPVLRGVSLGVRRGEFLAIVGQSGSGKSTLLHLLGTLDAPDRGEIHYDGRRIDNLPAAGRDELRNRRFGMIFQFYHLLPELTTLENVLSPLMITHGVWSYWRNRRRYRDEAAELLKMVGIDHRMRHRPNELSGGEMQRAAIAPRVGHAAQPLVGRRADRQSRSIDRSGHHPHLAQLEPPATPDYSNGDARPLDRRSGRSNRSARRRADRGVKRQDKECETRKDRDRVAFGVPPYVKRLRFCLWLIVVHHRPSMRRFGLAN